MKWSSSTIGPILSVMRRVPGRMMHLEFLSLGRSLLLESFVVRARPGMVRRNKRRVLGMNAKRARSRQHRMMPHSAKNLVRLSLVVVNSLPVAPAMRCEVERHYVVLFAIKHNAGRARRAVGIHRPSKVSD